MSDSLRSETITEQETFEDILHAIDHHRSVCEDQGSYIEADMAKTKLQNLRDQDFA